jgi:hypothetical protein
MRRFLDERNVPNTELATEPAVVCRSNTTELPNFPCVRFPTDSDYESGWRPGARMRPKTTNMGASNGHCRRRHFRGLRKHHRIHGQHDQRLRAHQRRSRSALRHRGTGRPAGLAIYDRGAGQRLCRIRTNLSGNRRIEACASRLGAARENPPGALGWLRKEVGAQLLARDAGFLFNLKHADERHAVLVPARDGAFLDIALRSESGWANAAFGQKGVKAIFHAEIVAQLTTPVKGFSCARR